FDERATVCKYAVPAGYPENPDAGAKVGIDSESAGDALLFYASVDERDDGVYTATSRAFAVVGLAESIEEAEEIAADALATADTDGLRVREDIGTADLIESRIGH